MKRQDEEETRKDKRRGEMKKWRDDEEVNKSKKMFQDPQTRQMN